MRDFETKVDNTAPGSTGILPAAEDNVRFDELKKVPSSSGITLDPAAGPDTDKTMLAQAVARYASGGVWYTDGGSANAYVLTTPLSFIMPKAYFDGMQVTFVPSADNTGASVATANGIGNKTIFNFDGSALSGGELLSTRHTTLIYSSAADSGAGGWLIAPWALPPVAGGGGEANTASNVGAGEGIFKTKSGVDLRLKSLVASGNLTITQQGADELLLSVADNIVKIGYHELSSALTTTSNSLVDAFSFTYQPVAENNWIYVTGSFPSRSEAQVSAHQGVRTVMRFDVSDDGGSNYNYDFGIQDSTVMQGSQGSGNNDLNVFGNHVFTGRLQVPAGAPELTIRAQFRTGSGNELVTLHTGGNIRLTEIAN